MPRARRCTSCRSRAAPRAEAISVATRPPRARGVPPPPPPRIPPPSPLPGDVFLVLSDQIARDYALSPDAGRVAFLVPGLVQGQFVSRTYVADITSKGGSAPPPPAGPPPRAAPRAGRRPRPPRPPGGKERGCGPPPGGGGAGKGCRRPPGRWQAPV